MTLFQKIINQLFELNFIIKLSQYLIQKKIKVFINMNQNTTCLKSDKQEISDSEQMMDTSINSRTPSVDLQVTDNHNQSYNDGNYTKNNDNYICGLDSFNAKQTDDGIQRLFETKNDNLKDDIHLEMIRTKAVERIHFNEALIASIDELKQDTEKELLINENEDLKLALAVSLNDFEQNCPDLKL